MRTSRSGEAGALKAAVLVALGLFVLALVGTSVASRLSQAPSTESNPPTSSDSTAVAAPTAALNSPTASPLLPTAPVAPPGSGATPTEAPAKSGYTYVDVAKHASPADCWIVVRDRVYDVTSYLRSHPGGSGTITPWCGKESTVAYETEDGAGTHSSRANQLLQNYYIGDLRR